MVVHSYHAFANASYALCVAHNTTSMPEFMCNCVNNNSMFIAFTNVCIILFCECDGMHSICCIVANTHVFNARFISSKFQNACAPLRPLLVPEVA